MTGASSGAQEDSVKAEAKVQDLQGRLKIAEQEKLTAEKAQQVIRHISHCTAASFAMSSFRCMHTAPSDQSPTEHWTLDNVQAACVCAINTFGMITCDRFNAAGLHYDSMQLVVKQAVQGVL